MIFFVIVSVPVTKAPNITKASYVELDADYSIFAGLAGSSALLGFERKKTLVKFTIVGSQAKMMFEKALPAGMDADCSKYILHDGRIVLRARNNNDPTHIYSADFTTKNTYKGNYGHLMGTLPQASLVYAKEISPILGWEVQIYNADNNHHQVLTLRPSKGRKWSKSHLSVCRNPHTGYMAAVHTMKTLDIYNEKGSILIIVCVQHKCNATCLVHTKYSSFSCYSYSITDTSVIKVDEHDLWVFYIFDIYFLSNLDA